MLICPYCGQDLKDQQTPCCGEVGHGVDSALLEAQELLEEQESNYNRMIGESLKRC